MYFKVSWKFHVYCFIFAFTICLILQNNILGLFISIFLDNKIIYFTGNDFLDINISIVLIFIPIAFVHELLHGVTYRLFGGKVKYGFKGIYAYALEATGVALNRTEFAIVLLAPVTIISSVCMLIPSGLGGVVYLLNLVGSTADLLMTLYLCKVDENSYIVDREYGFDVVESIDEKVVNVE